MKSYLDAYERALEALVCLAAEAQRHRMPASAIAAQVAHADLGEAFCLDTDDVEGVNP